MLITNLLSRYMKLCKAALNFCDGAKLNKSIQTNIIEMLKLQRFFLTFGVHITSMYSHVFFMLPEA